MAADTQRAARMLADAGAALVLFAGGDGTAADIVSVIGRSVPILGIPSGVKMRSGVFAASPEAAGDMAAEFLASAGQPVAAADVVDVVEGGAERAGPDRLPSVELQGQASVPGLGAGRLPGPKSSSLFGSNAMVDAMCRAVAENSSPARSTSSAPGRRRGGSSRSWVYLAPPSASTPSGTVPSSGRTSGSVPLSS